MYRLAGYLLPAKDLDVEASTVPNAHSEYKQQESAAPGRTVVEKEYGR